METDSTAGDNYLRQQFYTACHRHHRRIPEYVGRRLVGEQF